MSMPGPEGLKVLLGPLSQACLVCLAWISLDLADTMSANEVPKTKYARENKSGHESHISDRKEQNFGF